MQVSATGLAQKISLSKTNASLKTVLKEIRAQSGYDIFYSDDQLDKSKPVSLKVTRATIEEVLKQIFSNQPLTYSIDSKTVIVLDKKEPSFLDKLAGAFLFIDVSGRVTDAEGNPLSGATIKVKGLNKSTPTNEKGEFYLQNVDEKAVLEVSYVGYKVKELNAAKDLGSIAMELSSGELTEVAIVSTGYQNIPKERATGSFVLIDSALINRRVGTNILERLDGVTNGLIFNRNKTQTTQSDFNIRGRTTILGDDKPLIVVDNFPYEGDINNINPNDVKNITILKDAAAASIWGTRAGNGVIVITTYKGNYDSKLKASFNSDLTIGKKPNLYEAQWFSNNDWIKIEQFLFNKGAYNTTINNGFAIVFLPAVAIMDQRKKGNITSADSLGLINQLKQYDLRADILRYLYRPSMIQQYAFNLSGGS